MHAAAVRGGGLDQPVAVAAIIVRGEEDGLAVVAALDDVERLIGHEEAARAGHRPTIARARRGKNPL
jgi:hypothetical protein